ELSRSPSSQTSRSPDMPGRFSKDAGVRRDIASVVDIYKVATDQIRQTIRNYERAGVVAELNGRPVES
ncbi:hypothetical protein ACWDTP_20835, partial [Mycobacterium sp. NPDC003449]